MDLIENSVRDPIKHWYYQHKFWFVRHSKLWNANGQNSLVDIGAGSALFSKELYRQGVVKNAVAVDTGYKNKPAMKDGILFCQSTSYNGYSHFLLTDVLEHIEDDSSFLNHVVSQADFNSSFLITVPALMSLWSGHDVYLKHYRRYTKRELLLLAEKSGLKVSSVRYTYSTVFLAAYIQRKNQGKKMVTSHLKENGRFVSFILRMALLPDRWLPFLPFGVSIFLEATKNE